MTNPFDAAITILREFLGVRTLNGIPFDGASLVPALNVLEAAGKVDKDNAAWNMGEAFSQGREHVETMAPYREDHNTVDYDRAEHELNALLSALPDKVTP